MSENMRCGLIALVGAPNAGKSTLMNRLVGEKVGIVSSKANTTRLVVRGIVTQGEAQLIFVDTPGLNTSKKNFDRLLVQQAQSALQDADVVAVVVDAARGKSAFDDRFYDLVRMATRAEKPMVLILNKIDRVEPRSKLLALMQEVAVNNVFKEVFAVDAMHGKGTDDIVNRLAKMVPVGHWLFPTETITDVPLALRLAELTREKTMMYLQEELPYGVTVLPGEMGEDDNGTMLVQQDIIVSEERYKGMVVGKKGLMIQKIGSAARHDIERVLGRPVYLDLQVKIEEGWMEKRNLLKDLGLSN